MGEINQTTNQTADGKVTEQSETKAVLRVAIPNKGSLAIDALNLLKSAGYRTRRDERQLVLFDEENNVEFFYLRPKDIATYVGSGTLDFGVTGLDMLLDSQSLAADALDLKFASSAFSVAVPEKSQINSITELKGKRIATSLPTLLKAKLSELGVDGVEIVKLDGAVESSIKLGVADAIADVVSTGTTLKQAGLRIVGKPLLFSSARLIASPRALSQNAKLNAEVLKARLLGILRARDHVLLDFDLPESLVEKASAIAPGFAAPTISPLASVPPTTQPTAATSEKWVAVRVLAERKNLNFLMDELSALGAKAILATEIVSSRI